MLDQPQPSFTSLVDLVTRRAAEQGDERAYVFLSDKGDEEAALTFDELYQRALAVAAHLHESSNPGDRALLLFGPGLDFIIAYFGCMLAGVIAVPMMLPRRNSSRWMRWARRRARRNGRCRCLAQMMSRSCNIRRARPPTPRE